MKYIVEFEDEPCMYEDEVHFYKCIQAPWWGLSERVIKQLTPYQPDAPDTNVGNITNSCGHENDLISRQAAIDAMKAMYRAAKKWLRDATDDVTKARAESCMATLVEIKLRIDKTMGKGTLTDDDCMEAAKSVLGEDELPAVQPDRDVIDDCLRHIHKNISVHTATGGVIAIRYYMEKLYEEIYGEGERPWWMT